MKLTKLLLIVITWFISSIAVAETNSPLMMLQTTSNQLISELKQNQATLKTKPQFVYDLVHRILLPHVDLTGMARSVLGRDVWSSASADQTEKFTQEFTTLLIRTYSSALASYTNESVKFLPIRGDITGKTRVQVNSKILRQEGPAISVDYRLILLNDEWKLYDFSVDGISMLESFHSQFADELAKGDINSLINQLAEHNRAPKNS